MRVVLELTPEEAVGILEGLLTNPGTRRIVRAALSQARSEMA